MLSVIMPNVISDECLYVDSRGANIRLGDYEIDQRTKVDQWSGLEGAPLRQAPALSTNIRLGWKWLTVTSTLGMLQHAF